MTLKEIIDLLEFWIDKSSSSFFTKDELCALLDTHQMGLFTDYSSKASVNQRIKEAMVPFRTKYDFATTDTPAGVITVSVAGVEFERLLDIQVGDEPVGIPNEDERAYRLKSQIDPVTATNPICEIIGVGIYQLYPKTPNAGTVTFYRRPKKPAYATTGSGRGAAFDATNSQNLEWKDQQKIEVCVRALASLGINLSEADLAQYAEGKSTEQSQNLKHQ